MSSSWPRNQGNNSNEPPRRSTYSIHFSRQISSEQQPLFSQNSAPPPYATFPVPTAPFNGGRPAHKRRDIAEATSFGLLFFIMAASLFTGIVIGYFSYQPPEISALQDQIKHLQGKAVYQSRLIAELEPKALQLEHTQAELTYAQSQIHTLEGQVHELEDRVRRLDFEMWEVVRQMGVGGHSEVAADTQSTWRFGITNSRFPGLPAAFPHIHMWSRTLDNSQNRDPSSALHFTHSNSRIVGYTVEGTAERDNGWWRMEGLSSFGELDGDVIFHARAAGSHSAAIYTVTVFYVVEEEGLQFQEAGDDDNGSFIE